MKTQENSIKLDKNVHKQTKTYNNRHKRKKTCRNVRKWVTT